MDRKQVITFLLKAAVTLALLLFLFSRVEVGRSLKILASADMGLIAAAFCLMAFNFLAASLNLKQILGALGRHGSYFKLLKINYIVQFFVFSGLGELVGGLVKYKYLEQVEGDSRLPGTERLSVLLVEKSATVVATFLITTACLCIFYSDLEGALSRVTVRPRTLYLYGVLIGTALCLFFCLRPALRNRLRPLAHVLKTLLGNGGMLGRVFLNNAFIYADNILINYIVFTSAGVRVTFAQVVVLYLCMFLSQFLPISIGGLGVKENIVVFVMLFYGVNPEQSVAFSLICLCLTMLHSLLGGALFLLDRVGVTAVRLAGGGASQC